MHPSGRQVGIIPSRERRNSQVLYLKFSVSHWVIRNRNMWGHLDPLHPGVGWEPGMPRLHVSACVCMGFTFSNDLTALLTEQQFVAIK